MADCNHDQGTVRHFDPNGVMTLCQCAKCQAVLSVQDPYADFSNMPESLTERRAQQESSGGGIQTPRDALVSILREIDSGNFKPNVLVVTASEPYNSGGAISPRWRISSGCLLQALGLLELTKTEIVTL